MMSTLTSRTFQVSCWGRSRTFAAFGAVLIVANATVVQKGHCTETHLLVLQRSSPSVATTKAWQRLCMQYLVHCCMCLLMHQFGSLLEAGLRPFYQRSACSGRPDCSLWFQNVCNMIIMCGQSFDSHIAVRSLMLQAYSAAMSLEQTRLSVHCMLLPVHAVARHFRYTFHEMRAEFPDAIKP